MGLIFIPEMDEIHNTECIMCRDLNANEQEKKCPVCPGSYSVVLLFTKYMFRWFFECSSSNSSSKCILYLFSLKTVSLIRFYAWKILILNVTFFFLLM